VQELPVLELLERPRIVERARDGVLMLDSRGRSEPGPVRVDPLRANLFRKLTDDKTGLGCVTTMATGSLTSAMSPLMISNQSNPTVSSPVLRRAAFC
jgi:hypothetical protein